MSYVIRRSGDNYFVAERGQKSSYTNALQNARQFTTRESAEADACGNEYVQSLEEAMNTRPGD